MVHMAHSRKFPLGPGEHLSIQATEINAGDELLIESVGNKSEKATVVRSSPNILEIDVGEKRWRLAPLVPQETVSAPAKFGKKPLVVWVIQPE
jgi:hypothetical protein